MSGELGGMVTKGGWRGLFRGLGPTLLRDAPFSAIYWASYEFLKAEHGLPRLLNNHVNSGHNKNNNTTTTSSGLGTYVAAGSVSGMVAAAVTTPADVVKTRMQAGDGSRAVLMREVVKDVMNTEGPAGFTRGIAARVAKVTPACAIMMGSYELIKQVWTV